MYFYLSYVVKKGHKNIKTQFKQSRSIPPAELPRGNNTLFELPYFFNHLHKYWNSNALQNCKVTMSGNATLLKQYSDITCFHKFVFVNRSVCICGLIMRPDQSQNSQFHKYIFMKRRNINSQTQITYVYKTEKKKKIGPTHLIFKS